MTCRKCLLLTFLLLLPTSAGAADWIVPPPTPPKSDRGYPAKLAGAQVEIYKTVGDAELNANIFTPDDHQASDQRPAIVFFFGGGWRNGSPGQFASQCRYFAKRGMVAITFDYRVKSRHDVVPQQCLADAKSAIRWVRKNAKRLGVNPKRIVASGGSAGGHLAAATATIEAFDEPGEDVSISSRPNALVLFNPAVQLAPLGETTPEIQKRYEALKERFNGDPKSISPSHHVRQGLPPTMIFHGTNDSAVPFESVKRFANMMKKSGNRCELVPFEDRPHGFFNPGRGARSQKDFRETLRRADEFLISLKYLTPRPTVSVPETIEQQLNIPYATYGDRVVKLDLFAPRQRVKPTPAIVVVHGGGWLKGEKEKFRAMAIELASRGFVTAAIEYRLGGEAKFPAAIHDCSAAVRFLRANATQFEIDPDRIGAIGGSAGGHLVGLLAAGADVKQLQGNGGNTDQSSRLQAAIVLAGPLELASGPVAERSRTSANSNANQWIGKTVDEAPELYRLASATTHLSKQTPPLLFMAGEFDKPERNQATRDRLKELGVETQLIVVAGGKHGCWNRHPFFLPMIDDMHAFLSQHLGK